MKVVLKDYISISFIALGVATSVFGLIYLISLDSDSTSHSRRIGGLTYDLNVIRDDLSNLRTTQQSTKISLLQSIDILNKTILNSPNATDVGLSSVISRLTSDVSVLGISSLNLETSINKLTTDLQVLANKVHGDKSNPKYPWTTDQHTIIESLGISIEAHHARISELERLTIVQSAIDQGFTTRLNSLTSDVNSLSSLSGLESRVKALELRANMSSTGSPSSSSSTGGVQQSSSSTGPGQPVSSSTGSSLSVPNYFNLSLDVRNQVRTVITATFNSSYGASLRGIGSITFVGDSITCGLWASDTSSQSGTHYVGRFKSLVGKMDPGFINAHKYDDIYTYTAKRDIQIMSATIDKSGFDPVSDPNGEFYTNNQGANWYAKGQGEIIFGPYRYDSNYIINLTPYFFVGPEFLDLIEMYYYSCVGGGCSSITHLGTVNQYNNIASSDVYKNNQPSKRYQVTNDYTFTATQGRDYYIKISGTGPSSNLIGISLWRSGVQHVSTKCQPGYSYKYFGLSTANTYDGMPPLETFNLRPNLGGPVTDVGIIALGTADNSASDVSTAMVRIALSVGRRIPLVFLFLPSPANNKASFYDTVVSNLGNSLSSYPVMILDLSHIALAKLNELRYFSTLDLRGTGSTSGGDYVHPSDIGANLIAQHLKYYLDLCA